MSDVTDLKGEVLLLRKENKELRERLEESEHDASTAWDRALKAESVSKGLRMACDVWQKNDAKLRELVRGLLTGYECGYGELCEGCSWDGLGDPKTFPCRPRVMARELGIKAG